MTNRRVDDDANRPDPPPCPRGAPGRSPRRGPGVGHGRAGAAATTARCAGPFPRRPRHRPVAHGDRPLSARTPPCPWSRPPGPHATPPSLPDDRYLNRELSWLDFNARVLALAEDPSQPLLERAKFLAIFASNLDEFYMVRVAGLKRRDEAGLQVRSADGLTPREQLARISARTQALAVAHAKVFLDEVCPELEKEGIRINRWSSLTDGQRAALSTYFTETVFPVLTPLAVDPAHPFPYISGLSLNLAVTVRDPEGRTERFARVKVPNNVPRLVRVAPGRPGRQVDHLPADRGPDRRAPVGAVHRHGGGGGPRRSGSPATRTWRSRRTATKTCCRPWSASSPAAGSGRRCGSRSSTR